MMEIVCGLAALSKREKGGDENGGDEDGGVLGVSGGSGSEKREEREGLSEGVGFYKSCA